MKRYIYIIGIVLAAAMHLPGCMKLQTTRTDAHISFDPMIGHDTRAVESVPFPQERNFKVWAVNQTSGATHIQGEKISYSADGWKSAKLWPLDDLYFEACWPADLPWEYTLKGLQLKDFDCSEGDTDLLLAKAYDNNEEDDVVVLSFSHLLSRVEFRMLHSLPEDMSVRVKRIDMIGFAVKGDFNARNPGAWTVGEDDFSYVVYDAGDTDGILISHGVAQYITGDFYVIPQGCTASLDVQYEICYGTANWVPQSDRIESLMTQWEPGGHYTYTLNLKMDKLTHTTGISSMYNY